MNTGALPGGLRDFELPVADLPAGSYVVAVEREGRVERLWLVR